MEISEPMTIVPPMYSTVAKVIFAARKFAPV